MYVYDKEKAREYRKKNSVVEVIPAEHGDFDDEALIRISSNGRQFTCVDVTKFEAEKLIELLKVHFSL